jgi:dihydrofolate reductase
MRKLMSFHFMSLNGVIEAPQIFVRPDLYQDFPTLIGQTIAEQDAVLLGRTTYEEWAPYWPDSDIQPFADFINTVPKYVASKTLTTPDWQRTTVLSGPLEAEVAKLKQGAGGTIGVHGSIGLVASLLAAGLLDEMRFVLCPVVARSGRRLLAAGEDPIQLEMTLASTLPSGLQYLVCRPR